MDESDAAANLRVLNEFIVNCSELNELERTLGKFNLFRILRFEYGELRHSNVLSWLFSPNESHGLGDLFLRKWLMRVLLESRTEADHPSAVDVDCGEFLSVNVYREWHHIDILIDIHMRHQGRWIVVIENKVESTQSQDQLWGYRKKVEELHAKADHRIYVFLTKNKEEPDDNRYISADYGQVYEVLDACLNEKSGTIGAEPQMLIRNYLEILSEVFMENSDVAQLARRIYHAHKQAMDLIFQHRPDEMLELSQAVHSRLEDSRNDMRIVLLALNKGYVRFIPVEWNTEFNRQGTAWGKDQSAYVLFEVNFWTKNVRFTVVAGEAPSELAAQLWELCGEKPFRRTRRGKQPTKWIIMHSVPSRVSTAEIDQTEVDDIADELVEWIKKELQSDRTQSIKKLIAAELERFKDF